MKHTFKRLASFLAVLSFAAASQVAMAEGSDAMEKHTQALHQKATHVSQVKFSKTQVASSDQQRKDQLPQDAQGGVKTH